MAETTVTLTAGGKTTGPMPVSEFDRRVAETLREHGVDPETGEINSYMQPTLDDKVFAEYTSEHQISLKLTKGGAKMMLGDFGKLLSGEKLERGREVIVVARYFARTVHVTAATEKGYVLEGDGTVELELLNVRSLEVGKQLLRKPSPWKPCICVEPYDREEDGDYPPGRIVLRYPMDGWTSERGCSFCGGAGYTRPVIKPGDVNPEDESGSDE